MRKRELLLVVALGTAISAVACDGTEIDGEERGEVEAQAGEEEGGAPSELASSTPDEGSMEGALLAFGVCGTRCPAGHHVTTLTCNTQCGFPCFTANFATCAPNTGPFFFQCGTVCPSGYRAARVGCDNRCGAPCFSANSADCVAN